MKNCLIAVIVVLTIVANSMASNVTVQDINKTDEPVA